MTAEEALRRIGRGCLGHFSRNLAAALAGQPEAVHEMRIALRRLGSAVSAFKKMLPKADRRRLRADLAVLDAALGEARNLDVFASDLVAPCRAALAGEADFDALAEALERRRREAYRRVGEAALSPPHQAALTRLERWFEGCGGRRPGRSERLARPLGYAAPRLLDHRYREVRERGEDFRRLSPRQRHKLRIAVKKLRYTLELLAGLWPRAGVARFEKRLKRLQDDLGYANDVRVGHALVAALEPGSGAAAAGALVLAWHERALDAREKALRRHLRRLRQAEPVWRRASAG